LNIDSNFHAVGIEEKLPPQIETAFYRIIQEATTNALRHAEATRLEIRLDRDENGLIVTVRDDGKGFNADATRSGGMGLHGMRERAELVGGTLEVIAVAGAGTTIVAKLPFSR
jgi:two-component system sensor histidine kinase DegS